ncbi:MAG: pectate lyase, partial [Sphingomonadales bacterium]
VAPVTRDPAASAYEKVLAKAGASKVRDTVDARVVAGVRDRTGKQIDSQRHVGGWPALASLAAPRDSDGDGMPDAWEKAHGLNPKSAADGNMDRNKDGWTNLEEWLADLVK